MAVQYFHRAWASVLMVVGVLVLLVSGEFHEWVFAEVGSAGYVLGVVMLFGGAVSWIIAIRREKQLRAVQPPRQAPRSSQVIREISSNGHGLKMAGLGLLMYVGLQFTPWGLLLTIGAGALLLHGYRAGWFMSKGVSLHIFNGPVRIGGEIQAEIVLPAGVTPTGGGTAFLSCEQRTFRQKTGGRGNRDSDYEEIPLLERECHFLLDDAWRKTDQGLVVAMRIPVRNGLPPSQGEPRPRFRGTSSVVWILRIEMPLEKDRFGATFYVPVEAAQ